MQHFQVSNDQGYHTDDEQWGRKLQHMQHICKMSKMCKICKIFAKRPKYGLKGAFQAWLRCNSVVCTKDINFKFARYSCPYFGLVLTCFSPLSNLVYISNSINVS